MQSKAKQSQWPCSAREIVTWVGLSPDHKESLLDLMDTIKRNNIHNILIPEEKRKKKNDRRERKRDRKYI